MITWPGLNAAKLGNQLFGMAATLAYAARSGTTARFPEWSRTPFFSMSPQLFGEVPAPTDCYDQPSLPYDQVPALGGDGVVALHGNFISHKFFAGYEHVIRAAFASPTPYPRTDRVAIHVRRGDYVGGPYVSLEREWYEAQMAKFPGATFLVFSDAIPTCRAMFAGRKDVQFSEGGAEDDLHRMASCAGHIVANSTFSWWGAWLSGGGNVVRPAHYHTEAFRRRTPDVQRWEDDDFWPDAWQSAGPVKDNDKDWIG